MLKTLLCPITGNAADRAALDAAAVIARHFAGHVDVLHVKPDTAAMTPYLGDGMSPAVIGQIIEESERRAESEAALARATFDVWARERALPVSDKPALSDAASCAWRLEGGAEDGWIGQLGRLADLTVLPAAREGSTVGETLAFEAALLDTGRPVLLAPARALAIDAVAVIGWNGSPEAGRAIGAALPLLAAAREVHVVAVAEAKREAADPTAVTNYLAWHRISAKAQVIADPQAAAAAAIDAECDRLGAGLLVVGGYTHSRLRELLFGGVTTHVSRAPRIPVLMAH
ncbi:MAG: universal stress protein [Alphaproteobacteria bacterium]|nr:universal stress protein [Alphaproteobacteria bacterium]